MSAFIAENTAFFGIDGEPLLDGKIYIGIVNLDPVLNPTPIFSDREMTVVLANPQTLDSFGKSINKIWIPGRYSMEVDDSLDVLQRIDLDAGETPESGVTTLSNVQGTNDVTAEATPAITEYIDKEIYTYIAVNAITGSLTLDIDGVGIRTVKKRHDQNLVAGDVEDNQIVSVAANNTDITFELLSNPSLLVPTRAETSAFSVLDSDDKRTIICDASGGDFTVSGLAVATAKNGFEFTIDNNAATGLVTFDPSGGETVDGLTTFIVFPGEKRTFITNGTLWLSDVVSGSQTSIIRADATNVATVDIVLDNDRFKSYIIYISGVEPVSDGVAFESKVSINGGITFLASNYAHARLSFVVGGAPGGAGSNSDASIKLLGDQGSATNEFLTGVIHITNVGSTSGRNRIHYSMGGEDSTGNEKFVVGAGRNISTTIFDAIQFKFDSGNISEMAYQAIGINK